MYVKTDQIVFKSTLFEALLFHAVLISFRIAAYMQTISKSKNAADVVNIQHTRPTAQL